MGEYADRPNNVEAETEPDSRVKGVGSRGLVYSDDTEKWRWRP